MWAPKGHVVSNPMRRDDVNSKVTQETNSEEQWAMVEVDLAVRAVPHAFRDCVMCM